MFVLQEGEIIKYFFDEHHDAHSRVSSTTNASLRLFSKCQINIREECIYHCRGILGENHAEKFYKRKSRFPPPILTVSSLNFMLFLAEIKAKLTLSKLLFHLINRKIGKRLYGSLSDVWVLRVGWRGKNIFLLNLDECAVLKSHSEKRRAEIRL